MEFEFFRFRFHFRSVGEIYFPPHKSGNTMRGAFGHLFRKLVCMPSCADAKSCKIRSTCPYALVFEPHSARGEGPSGIADWPRPFVFRAAHLDGRTIRRGEQFHFDLHLFDRRNPVLAYFVRAFACLAKEGLGPGRGRAGLEYVDQLNVHGSSVGRVFEGERFQTEELAAPIVEDLCGSAGPVQRARIRFVTPTELKSGNQAVGQPAFAVLFARLRDRISTLRILYGAGTQLEIDFRAMGERAAAVNLVHCRLQRTEVDRRSSRTGQRQPLGGFSGEAEYAGDLAEFVPYLRLGKWVGVGRQTVWGKGQIEIIELA